MDVSQETSAETDARLQRVIASVDLEILPGDWYYEEIGHTNFEARISGDAIALVRDSDGWSQLRPVSRTANQHIPEQVFCVWSFHFPAGVDNSGFVGWLASHIKHLTGSGVIVVCGTNSRRGGIYDYWGCPGVVRDEVLAAVHDLARAR